MKNNETTVSRAQQAKKAKRAKTIRTVENFFKIAVALIIVVLILMGIDRLTTPGKTNAAESNAATQTTGTTDSSTTPEVETTVPSTKSEVTNPEEEELARYITLDLNSKVNKLDLEITDRPQAFGTEMMNRVITNGIKEAKKADCDLAFCFEGNLMFVDYDEASNIYSASFQFYDGTVLEEKLMDCSIFRSQENNVVVYGYTNDGEWFEKVTLDGENSKREILSYDANLPFYMIEESKISVRLPDGESLFLLDDNMLAIYKDGQEVTIETYKDEGNISFADMEMGFFITDKGQVYTISVSRAITGEPLASYEFAGFIQKDGKFIDTIVDESDNIVLPIFLDGKGNTRVLVPHSWEDYLKQAPSHMDEVMVVSKVSKCTLVDISELEFESDPSSAFGGYYLIEGRKFYDATT
jgi:hypothetical protein